MEKNFLKLLKEVNEAYPDNLVEAYFDLSTGEERINPIGGFDTLALFIGRELRETYENGSSMNEARGMAIQKLLVARQEIDTVIRHLTDK